MKVLIVNLYSHEHSTGQIAYALLNYLRNNGHKAKLCCRGTRETMLDDVDVVPLDNILNTYYAAAMTRLTGIEGIWNRAATRKLIHTIRNFQPDIVQIYSLHGFYLNHFALLRFLKQNGVKTVYSMIDEYPYMGKCCFSFECEQFKTVCKNCPHNREYPQSWFWDRANKIFKMKKKIYDGFENIVFTGPQWTVKRAKESALLGKRFIEVLDEPVDFGRFYYPRNSDSLRRELGIRTDVKVVLTVSDMRYPRKGGMYFMQGAEKLKERKDIQFIAIGCTEGTNVPDNVIARGFEKSQDKLAEFMSLADLFVCTSLADTQPNVCLYALGCGTPLAGFSACGTPYCAPEPLGTFTSVFDLDALAEIIGRVEKKTDEMRNECCQYAYKRYSSEKVFNKLMNIYNKFYI